MKNIMIKYFICFLILISIPNVVWAGEVSFDCPHESVIGGRLICSVSVDTEYDVKGILGKYRYDRAFSYLKVNALGKWDLLVNNAEGVSLIAINGGVNKSKIFDVSFFVSGNAEVGEGYNLGFYDVSMSDGDLVIDVDDIISKIKIVDIKDVFKSIVVDGKSLELVNGVVSNVIDVDYNVSEVRIDAVLDESKYQFKSKYGSREVSNLKVGENTFYLKVLSSDNDLELLTYSININRLPKVENPKTSSFSVVIVGFILVISIMAFLVAERFIARGRSLS